MLVSSPRSCCTRLPSGNHIIAEMQRTPETKLKMKTGCKLANRNTMGAVMIDILILLLTTLFCIHFIDVYELIKNIE